MMKQEHILIAGGTGMVGKALVNMLLQNHKVTILTRGNSKKTPNNTGLKYKQWYPAPGSKIRLELEDVTVVINLAGANIFAKPWSEKYKQEILDSRVDSTSTLVNAINTQPNIVHTFISTSAIGIYGADTGDGKAFTENDEAKTPDFLTKVCKTWEAEALKTGPEVRTIINRFGLVQSIEGGSFKESLKPLNFRVAATLGDGNQVFSWIHIYDLCKAISDEIEHPNYSGIYNLVAPEPVSNRIFSQSMATAMYGNAYITMPMPAFILKILLGERSVEVLKSCRVSSGKLLSSGFKFQYPGIDTAMKALVKEYKAAK